MLLHSFVLLSNRLSESLSVSKLPRSLPLSPSWTNLEDCKFDDTHFSAGFPSGLSPIAEEETAFVK